MTRETSKLSSLSLADTVVDLGSRQHQPVRPVQISSFCRRIAQASEVDLVDVQDVIQKMEWDPDLSIG